MVWVPDLALRPDFLGLGLRPAARGPLRRRGRGARRGGPGHAAAEAGPARQPGRRRARGRARSSPATSAGRPAARRSSLVEWNPFVAERLLMGHWPVLRRVRRAAVAGARRRRGRAAGRVPLAAVVAAAARQPERQRRAGVRGRAARLRDDVALGPRRWRCVPPLVLAANAPWLVAGLLHAVDGDLRRRRGRGLRAAGRGVAARRRWPPSASAGSGTREVVPGSRDRACWPGSRSWCWSSSPRSASRAWSAARRRRRDAGGLVVCWAAWAGAWPC